MQVSTAAGGARMAAPPLAAAPSAFQQQPHQQLQQGEGGDPGHTVFVSWEEKREPSDRKPPRKSSGHTYTVKFFLVDINGLEHLAATGEDQGDAHYLYENMKGFPFLRAQNKADVRDWLEGIMQRSQDRAGVTGHVVQDAVPQDPGQIRLPKFVGHTHERRELADGRHRIEWFLLDENNDSHLAVVGEEKETRDGHYQYRTQGIFDKAAPLQVGNQREVERWLEAMVVHGGQAPAAASGKAPGEAGGSGRQSALASDLSAQRGTNSRGGTAPRPHAPKAGLKHDLLKQATSNAKKLKAQQGRLGADPDQDARDAVGAELARWAQEEAQRREAAKRQALAYAAEPLAGKEAAAAKRCLAVLKQAASSQAFLPPPPGSGGRGGGAGTHQQQVNLVDTLAALRELAHMYVPLSLVALPELKETLAQLQEHRHPDVSGLAAGILQQWLRTAVAQAQVLCDERYVQDPRSVLEARLATHEAFDPIVAAVTHRTLQSPQQQAFGAAAGRPAAGGQPHGGSRLGAPEDSLAAVTPLGLSTQPSAQSLQEAGLAGGSGDYTAQAQETAERRRLNLEGIADSPGRALAAGARGGPQRDLTLSSSGGGGETGEEEATTAGQQRQYGGTFAAAAVIDDEPSEAQQPSATLASSDGVPQRDSAPGGLPLVPSVDLIVAPIQEMEAEQAEMLM